MVPSLSASARRAVRICFVMARFFAGRLIFDSVERMRRAPHPCARP
jgi:hypothetical protein